MATLLTHEEGVARVLEHDPWVVLDDGATSNFEQGGERQDVVVKLDGLDDARGFAGGRLGVAVSGDTDADALAARLEGVALVVIEIPKFTDGRAYSLARLLRDKHGYEGELRASGHVMRDQLFYMARCGFDSFVLPEGANVEDALKAFADFSATYQPSSDHDEPIWRRRRSS